MTQPPFPPPGFPPPPGPPPPPPFGSPGFAPSPPPRRRANPLVVVLAVLVALIVVGAAVLVPLILTRGDDDEPSRTDSSRGTGETDGGDESGGTDTGDLEAVAEYDDLATDHLDPGEDHDYSQSPPVGGEHAPVWLECGVYDEELPEVNVVHDLEHGTVWITYREDLVDDAGIDQLGDQLPDNGILSPYAGQDAPVVITVWGRQLALDGPDDSRIPLFIEEYGAGDTAPEPFASCHGGLTLEDLGDLAPSGGGVSA
ncbi:DUF3105 domain-containing protein [Nocardioides caeni]|uniref:DUF3105 domain-containing protein n=1 Tax=Nocardioides caeni TaxID=574700 RepID=A0A4S8NNY5_9ACTN|nr:DUF3105 domain-containing protein [Nocardioides caeni]THV18643.1 DUF3105 domain-containing protein [Nocardioides caeni]